MLRVPLNLFNWLALMLVLGVGANYAVFLREGALRAAADLGAVWTGVLLSAATTLLSFGMLGMSAMPALRSFGATLALGIAVSVLLAPIGMPSKRRGACHEPCLAFICTRSACSMRSATMSGRSCRRLQPPAHPAWARCLLATHAVTPCSPAA